MNEPKDIEKRENGAGRSEAERKPKKRPRVSQRKELAVVTVGMVATIASFGGLLAGHQAQADQPANATPAAQSSSTTPGPSSSGQSSNDQETEQVPSDAPGSSSSGQPTKQQAPAYAPATQGTPPRRRRTPRAMGRDPGRARAENAWLGRWSTRLVEQV